MGNVNRTASCKNCGEVTFRIIPTTGYVNVECFKCNKQIGHIYCGEYTTMSSNCDKCGSNEFKAKIRVEEDNGEVWDIKCVKCGNDPKGVFVDDKGIIIDEKSREILMANDKIRELKERIEELENDLDEKSDELDDYESQLDYKNNEIDVMEYELGKYKRRCSELESKVSDLERNIRNNYY